MESTLKSESNTKPRIEIASDGTAFEAIPWIDDGSSWTPEEEAANIETILADNS